MGQAVIDLPDPLENGDVSKAASADDLLAQLASDEIDRLLAEADTEAPPMPLASQSSALSAALPDAPVSTPPTTELPAWLEAELPPASAVGLSAAILDGPVAPRPLLSPAAKEIAAELDAAPPAAQSISALPPLPADLQAAASALNEAPAIPPPAPVVVAEKPSLPTTPEIEPIAQPVLDPVWTPGELPLILKPLEWLNAPLDLCPENVREIIGKAAILTMVNAIGVLVYVWMFRHHH